MLSCGYFNFGIHHFMLGKTGLGAASAIISGLNIFGYLISYLLMFVGIGFITIWFNVAITFGMWIWGIIDGIMILTNQNYRDGDGYLLGP
jgi:hypothetical protein